MRGSDIPFNPVFFAWALVTTDGCWLWCMRSTDLVIEGVTISHYESFLTDVKQLSLDEFIAGSNCNWAIARGIGEKAIKNVSVSSVSAAKAVKNPTEIQGFRQCHVRDAAALCEFFAWLEEQKSDVTECQAADKLESFRKQKEHFVGLSFDTIAGSGPNGAIIHYKPEHESCSALHRDKLFLLDSGAQYLDGTTDVTRTIHLGTPSQEERDSFTRVLMGCLDLQAAVFPEGTSGFQLDLLARRHLWAAGLDFAHGTGHGVGHFLNVHEGPQSISCSVRSNDVPLKPGMTVTDEPGYYKDGHYGIRNENVLIVKEANLDNTFRDTKYLTFENVTMVPYQVSLLELHLLEKKHVSLINEHHARCLELVMPLLEPNSSAARWLEKATRPINQ